MRAIAILNSEPTNQVSGAGNQHMKNESYWFRPCQSQTFTEKFTSAYAGSFPEYKCEADKLTFISRKFLKPLKVDEIQVTHDLDSEASLHCIPTLMIAYVNNCIQHLDEHELATTQKSRIF